ncbi:nucleoside transporter family protein [Coleophoma cylindrospora]|uniref:Nucleoside transporter family protein n=1 Tax=Coleophoma cylindrospora TaxID=1849047 RepID=A0A3D8R6U4_9HELO|nr:nucleoside transporter family protein [Coleophoma cylindrospora]
METPAHGPTDIEKGQVPLETSNDQESATSKNATATNLPSYDKPAWKTLLASAFVEARGIDRVMPDERQQVSVFGYVQMLLLWFSANLTANNIALGFLGPSAYGLSFLDTAMCAVFGSIVGAMGAAYTGTFGPISGNRTMIIARYTMGWWPSRICVLLNIVIMLGYGMIDSVIGGQILSAVANNNMTVIVGIIIVAVITWVVTVFGLPLFHVYERYAWAPQMAVVFILIGVAGPNFDVTYASSGNSATVIGDRISIFSLFVSAGIAWAPAGADYYVYYPENTPKYLTFLLTSLGLGLSTMFAYLVGAGIASGIATTPAWSDAYEISSGAVLVAAFDGLGGFGKFCGVILALGVIANNVPGTYSAALGFQCLGSWPKKVPRAVWNTFGAIVYTICAAVGRNHLYDIFENFLALMGYWVTIWLTITLEEQFIFRRKIGYNWEDWDNKAALPLGLAALAAFLIGWVGAVLDMDQIYFVGPIAKLVGDYGADLGIFVGVGFAAITFPPLRFLEKKYVGR